MAHRSLTLCAASLQGEHEILCVVSGEYQEQADEALERELDQVFKVTKSARPLNTARGATDVAVRCVSAERKGQEDQEGVSEGEVKVQLHSSSSSSSAITRQEDDASKTC